MSKKEDDPTVMLIRNVAKLEAIVNTHEERIAKLEKAIDDMGNKLNEILMTQKVVAENLKNINEITTLRGLRYVLQNIVVPVVVAIISFVILKGLRI